MDFHPQIQLSKNEKELLQLLSLGMTKNTIAQKLSISKYTVDKQLRNIFIKLNVHSTVAAVASAIRKGDIS
jgi:DNA-binding CsgD family transcriptional regulator